MNDKLADLYTTMISEAKQPTMTVGNMKMGDLPGQKPGVFPPKSGPDAPGAKTMQKAVEAPVEFSPVKGKKQKEVKESTNMSKSFQELYDNVINEKDIESPDYNEEIQDFPPTAGEEVPGEEVPGEEDLEGGMEGERDVASIVEDIKGLLDELVIAVGGSPAGEMGPEDEMGAEEGEPQFKESVKAEGKTIKEMKSEPEPKDFKAPISSLQLPGRKLGGTGVKVPHKKMVIAAGGKKHTGEPEAAPKGFTPGDKGMMKVGGTGPAVNGKDTSAFEEA